MERAGKVRESITLCKRAVNRELGDFRSAKIVMVNVDFADIEQCQSDGAWNAVII